MFSEVKKKILPKEGTKPSREVRHNMMRLGKGQGWEELKMEKRERKCVRFEGKHVEITVREKNLSQHS